jgi:hypothetical protein
MIVCCQSLLPSGVKLQEVLALDGAIVKNGETVPWPVVAHLLYRERTQARRFRRLFRIDY